MEIKITVQIDDAELLKLFRKEESNSTNETQNSFSSYARFFDDGCLGWERDSELNHMFLLQKQTFANERLKAQGYLFLNDVYDMLGIPRSKAGQVVGWVYNEENPCGDNYVDFGLNNESSSDFINGFTNVVMLDFKV